MPEVPWERQFVKLSEFLKFQPFQATSSSYTLDVMKFSNLVSVIHVEQI